VFKRIWGSLATLNGTLVVDGSEAVLSRTSEKEKTKKRPRDDSPARQPSLSVNLIQDLVGIFIITIMTLICQLTRTLKNSSTNMTEDI